MTGVASKGSGILQGQCIWAPKYWTTWAQPLCYRFAFCRRIGSHPESGTLEKQYIMIGAASVVASDRRRLTCVTCL
uniref:Secreted protein n=1 Tax=Mesocestoides corti TaxID=53468 RepID=A0A5K3EMS1_MESCO